MDPLPPLLAAASAAGIYLHPTFVVAPSALGGVGIAASKPAAPGTVVLRVPKRATYDLDSLLALASELKHDDTALAVLNHVLSTGGNFSETAIVRSYMWGLRILQRAVPHLAPLRSVTPYLDVLAATPVVDVDASTDDPDHLVQQLVKEKRNVRRQYDALVDAYPPAGEHLPFAEAFHLHQAVKSRVLEIPYATGERYVNEDDEVVGNADDFSTNVTLVPVLDFANHSRDNNAVFDVDRATDEVVLRLVRAVQPQDEVCISYSPTNALDVFFRTYGFVPQGRGVFKWKIQDLNGTLDEAKGTTGENYERIAKWLHIVPQLLAHIRADGAVSLDLSEFRIPLLMVPGLKYYALWHNEVADITAGQKDIYTGLPQECIRELQNQEATGDVVYGSDTAYGVTWNDTYVSISAILEQTWEDSEEGINKLIAATVPAVHIAARRLKLQDAQSAQRHRNSMLDAYYKFKQDLLEKLLELSFADYMRMLGEGDDMDE